METVTKKKIAPMWALIAVIIIAGILFLAFRPTNQADAPTIDITNETVATSTVATSTEVTPPTAAPSTADTGVQVIQGDGFTATVRQVAGVAPTIQSFMVRQSAPGASCIFTWDTKDASSCEVINTIAKTSVRGVPVEGTLQTSDAGSYQLSCTGSGGTKTLSALVSCN